MRRRTHLPASYLRSFIFGVEDSLVSTVGLISGIAIAGVSRETILLTGIVLVLVEAFSMAAGDFLSEESAESYERGRESSIRAPLISGLIMFGSYLGAGCVPLAPYVFLPSSSAFWVSIQLSLGALFLLGLAGGRISGVSILKNGARTVIVGGIAILVGVLAGELLD